MKNLFLFLVIILFSANGFSQSNNNGHGRKGKINRQAGGFVQTKFVCSHSKNCLFTNGYHEITAYTIPDNEEFCTYKGNFLGRRFHGQGEYHNSDGSLDYVGTFKYGFFNNGVLTNNYGDTLSGHFKKDDKKWYLENGYISSSTWYTLSDTPDDLQRSDDGDKIFLRGFVKDGKLNGHVYFKVLTGDYAGTEFDGNFVDGKIEGCGIMKIYRQDDFLSPDVNYSNDCYISFKSLNPSGDIYMGQWSNCSYNGWGILTSQQYSTSYGYWNANQVSTDIPFSIVAQTLEDVCHFNVDWNDYTPTIDSSDYDVIPSLPDLGDGGHYIVDVISYDAHDNRGNVSRGVKITHKINYIKATVQGDYPPGQYNLSSSKNAMALLHSLDSTIKIVSDKILDSLSYNLIDTSTVILFEITATTDRKAIVRPIQYIWDIYGLDSVAKGLVYTIDPSDPTNDYTIGKAVKVNQKIKYNSQLAFLRATGIKKFLSDSLNLNTDHLSFKFQIDTVATHRAIGVEMFIKNSNDNLNPRIVHNRKIENDVPKNNAIDNKSAAILIYLTKYDDQKISSNGLIYANDDAMLVKNYLTSTLCVNPNNIRILKDIKATTSDINYLFDYTLLEMAKQGVENFYLYYQGHGFADDNKSLYMLPYNTRLSNNGTPIIQDIDSVSGYINRASKIIKDSLNIDVNFFTIFDACASYTATKTLYAGRSVKNFKSSNSCLISASEMFKVAMYDNSLEHSLLSYGFCYSLFDFNNSDVNSDNELSFDEIYLATKKFVVEQTTQNSLDSSSIQTPMKYGQGKWNKNVLNINNLVK